MAKLHYSTPESFKEMIHQFYYQNIDNDLYIIILTGHYYNYFIMLIYSPGLADLMLDSGLLLAEMPPAVSDLRSNACTLAGHRAMVGGLV